MAGRQSAVPRDSYPSVAFVRYPFLASTALITGAGLIITLFSRPWTERFETKWVLIASEALMITGSVILPFADSPHKYWSRDFPAFVIGTSGASFLFVNAK